MHSSSQTGCRILALATLCVAASPFAVAQTPAPETNAAPSSVVLDAVVVAAEREPGNFILDPADIERTNAVDLSQLFANLSTLAVGGGAPHAQKIYVRGFEDVLLNVTIDGAPQAGELYHHQGRLQLEPEFIKSIQLDAGAGAATAGAGALTGALSVTTKDAFDLLEPGQRFGVSTRASVSVNGDNAWQGVGSVYGKLTDNVGLVIGFSRQSGDDYEDGHGDLVTPTGFEHERGYAKLNGRFGDHAASLAYERVHDTGTYYERPNFVNFTGTYILSDHEVNRETVTYNHRFNPANELIDARATVFWTASDFENHRNTTGALYGAGDFKSIGLDLRNTSQWEHHAATYGIEYRSDDAFGRQQATPPPFWGFSEQNASVLGLYAQDNWKVSPTVTLSAGLRFDSYEHDVDRGVGAGVSNSDSGFSPNASLEWEALPGLTLRASYAQAFRGITIREAFFSGLYIHDGGLDPEKADNLEFGFSYEKNGFFLRGTLYRQKIENYINAVYVGTPVWGYWRNTGDAEVEGYEAEIGHRWRTVNLSLGVWEADNSFNGVALTDADLGLGTSIGRTWIARLDWFATTHSEFGVRARHVEAEPNAIAPSAPDKPAYTTVDLHAHWRPFDNRRLTLSLSINNVFDEFYYDHATYSYHSGTGKYIGFPAKGREFVLSASVKF